MNKVFGCVFYIIGFFITYILAYSGLHVLVESIRYDDVATIFGVLVMLLLMAIPVYFLLKYANRWTGLKRKYFVGVFIIIIVYGFMSNDKIPNKKYSIKSYENVSWSAENVNWSNFKEVKEIEGNFSASIYSGIYCPNEISRKDSVIYAYMKPEYSMKLNDSLISSQLLIHEQNHFNITEYYTRLLRKAVI